MKKPPYSEEGEKGLIGSILLDANNVVDVCVQEKLTTDAFYHPAHKAMFTAIGTLVGKGQPVDSFTVMDHLRRKGKLDMIGGQEAVEKIIDQTPTSAHVEYYIELVKKCWMKRRIISACREVEANTYDAEVPETIRSKAEQAFTMMHEIKDVRTLRDIFLELKKDLGDAKGGKPVVRAVPTGFECIDDVSEGGMRKSGVYWLSGEPSTGKTSLKCNIIDRVLDEGHRVADLTLEMTKRQEVEKLVSVHTNKSVSQAMRGETIIKDHLLDQAEEDLVNSKQLIIADQSEVSTTLQFWSWARRMVTKYKVDLITLDYLQLLETPEELNLFGEQQVTYLSKTVKHVAGVLQVPVLCVAAINAGGKVRYSRMADYDGAGHWQLLREDENAPKPPLYPQTVKMVTKKSRFGVPFVSKYFIMYGSTGVFEETIEGKSSQEEEDPNAGKGPDEVLADKDSGNGG